MHPRLLVTLVIAVVAAMFFVSSQTSKSLVGKFRPDMVEPEVVSVDAPDGGEPILVEQVAEGVRLNLFGGNLVLAILVGLFVAFTPPGRLLVMRAEIWRHDVVEKHAELFGVEEEQPSSPVEGENKVKLTRAQKVRQVHESSLKLAIADKDQSAVDYHLRKLGMDMNSADSSQVNSDA